MHPLLESPGRLAGLLLGLDPGRGGLHVIDPRDEAHQQRDEEQQGRDAQDDQRPRRLVAEQVQEEPALGVQDQDIAAPDQVGMDQADRQQPEDAAIVDPADRAPLAAARWSISTSPAPKSMVKMVIILPAKNRY